MKYCANCKHPKKDHKGINGECCHTDFNNKWNCQCSIFLEDKGVKMKTKKQKTWKLIYPDGTETLFSYDPIKEAKKQAKKEISRLHFTKDNHQIGCELESYTDVLFYRRLIKEHDMLLEVASRLK